MKMAIAVAKAELRNLFYSPVAWLMLIAFLVQCGWYYSVALEQTANWQDIYLKNNSNFTAFEGASFTRALFVDTGFFMNVTKNLYLFLPLLTMGLIGREMQQGTVKLLYSSPITVRQIVVGKFLAILIFNLLLVLVVGVFCVSAAIQIKSVDYGMLLSALLGIYLLAGTYGAIGAFMSSITTYQVVSALSTFLVLLSLSKIGGFWQQYDFVRDLTFFLNLGGRAEKMLVGLITTKDVIYFLVVILLFLIFTILKLRAARKLRPWYFKAVNYFAVTVIALMIGYISSRPQFTGYWDTTQQQVNTIDTITQHLIREMGDEPLEVTMYVNYLGRGAGYGMPAARNYYLSWVWENYTRFKPDIKFKYEYYYDYDSTIMGNMLYKTYPGKTLEQIVQKVGEYSGTDVSYFQKPEEMRKKIDLRAEGLALVMQLKYKDRTEFLRIYNDNEFWPREENFAAVFKKLLYPEKVPHVSFITGHYERHIYKNGEREYGNHTGIKDARISLVNHGFNIDTLSIENSDIPAHTDILVLADPKSDLSEQARKRISSYIDRGGNLFIMGEPGKQQVLNPLLLPLDIYLEDGIILTESKQEAQDMVHPSVTMSYFGLLKDPSRSDCKDEQQKPGRVLMPGLASIQRLDSSEFSFTPLLRTVKETTWRKKGPFVRDSAKLQFQALDADVRYISNFDEVKEEKDAQEGEYGNGFTTLAAMHRERGNKDQRIIVAGDADFLSNSRYADPPFAQYRRSLYSWLNNGEFPISITVPQPPDNLLRVTGTTAKVFSIIYIYVLPGVILLLSSILLIKRKRQ